MFEPRATPTTDAPANLPRGHHFRSDEARRRAGMVPAFFVAAFGLLVIGIYASCIAAVIRGHLQALDAILPWLAIATVGGCVIVTLSALGEQWHRRLHQRRLQSAADRLSELAKGTAAAPGESEREGILQAIVKDLNLTLEALSLIVDPRIRERLVAARAAERVAIELGESHGTWHRVTAAGVLALLGSADSIEPLAQALAAPDPDVAYAAAQALAGYPEPAAYEALLDALTLETIPPARIAGLLEAFRCPQARELIEQRAAAGDPRLRYWAAYLLSRLGDPRSAPAIERLTRDTIEDVRASAAAAIASFPSEATLRRLLSDDSWVVRAKAAKAAGAANQLTLVPELAKSLEDDSWWVRQNAANALAEFGDAAVPTLLAQLHSPDRFARNRAGEVLVQNGFAASQVERLRDDEYRESAQQRLVDLGRSESLSTVVSVARTTADPELRACLVDVLRAIDTEQAAAALTAIPGTERPLTPERQSHPGNGLPEPGRGHAIHR